MQAREDIGPTVPRGQVRSNFHPERDKKGYATGNVAQGFAAGLKARSVSSKPKAGSPAEAAARFAKDPAVQKMRGEAIKRGYQP